MNMHINDKYTGCVECYTGCKTIPNERYPKSVLSMLLTITLKVYLTSFWCMRDTVVLK